VAPIPPTKQGKKKQAGPAEIMRRKAMSHPTRERIFRHWIEQGVMAPVEVSHALDIPIREVSYHTRMLVDYGCLELVKTGPGARGSTKHYYRAIDRHVVDQPEWEELGLADRDGVAAGSMQPLVDDFERAARDEAFRDPDGDFHLTRIPIQSLDAQGFGELRASYMRLYKKTYEIEAAAAERMKTSGERGSKVSAGLTCWRISSF
jgi:Helix-turn-helix domain